MRIIAVLLLAVSFIYANGSLDIKKGWQLIGVSTTVDIEQSFNNKNVEIVWGYDASTQSWSGYSPNDSKSAIITQSYSTLTTLKPFQALWIFSNDDWTLEYTQASSTETPINSTIMLYEGWNLVSIPQNTIVSDKFFGEAIVWKYSEDQEWSVNNNSLNFPTIDAIKQSEGLWVKSSETKTINIDKQSSKLQTFDSRDNMLAYIRKMLEMNRSYYMYTTNDGGISFPEDTAAVDDSNEDGGSTTSTGADDATSTNLQEEGVDEGDILKHDNTYIYSADNTNGKIIVTSFENITKKIYTPITSLDFSGKYIKSMYLQNSRLSVISSNNSYYLYDYAKEYIKPSQNNNSLELSIYDVSDVNNITQISTHTIDGYYKDSRLIDGNLYLISEFTPDVEYEYPKIYTDTICSTLSMDEIGATCNGYSTISSEYLEDDAEVNYEKSCEYGEDYTLYYENNCYQYSYDDKGAWKYDYTSASVVGENLVPTISSNSQSPHDLVDVKSFYAPMKLNQSANITTISRFSIDSGEYKVSSSFLGNTHTHYASLNSLYLVSSEYPLYYDYAHYKEQQMIYKFSFDGNLSYIGRGFVEGRMLNQFSMSEKDDYLRVATTSGWSWWADGGTNNSVYTMTVKDEELSVEAELEGLGHENETIKAVRFMGDRGFVVTFEQTDPLYTLDLSDPKEPKVIGELSIPGFSSYLHIVDENRVLSIGRNADENGRSLELQFQLFDISDYANPVLADKVQIGDEYSYSEAEYNHKAFSYRSNDLMFGVPYRTYSRTDYSNSENFGLYKIDDLTLQPVHTITSSSSDWGDVGRGLIFDLNSTTYGALLKGSNIVCEDIK